MMTDWFSLLCLISYPNEIQEVHSSRLGDNKAVELLAVYRPHELHNCAYCIQMSFTLLLQHFRLVIIVLS